MDGRDNFSSSIIGEDAHGNRDGDAFDLEIAELVFPIETDRRHYEHLCKIQNVLQSCWQDREEQGRSSRQNRRQEGSAVNKNLADFLQEILCSCWIF